MNVNFDSSAQTVAGGIEEVRASPAAVPEVLGRVLVGDKDESDGGVGRIDAYSGGGKVFGGRGAKGLEEGFDEVGVLPFERMLLGVGGFLELCKKGFTQNSRCAYL